MQRKTIFSIATVLAGLIVYCIIRADAWRLLLFSENAVSRIVHVDEIRSDPHTTSWKVAVRYVFTDRKGIAHYGTGERVLRKGENTADLSWLMNTSLDVVYVAADPDINNVSGREAAVLFPLVLIPFIFVINAMKSHQSRTNPD